MPADPQMLHSFDCLRGRQVRMGARNLRHLVSEPGEFLGEREPDFLDRTAHQGRDRKKRAQNNRDLHFYKVVTLRAARRGRRMPQWRGNGRFWDAATSLGMLLLSSVGLQGAKH